ncbi:type II toxin-antitoxin system death-on-curing family toxin [Spirosoma agri]|nr:type II toxin-antitoxin system death-on-curing family toxin [Spirosoma agri]
MGNRRITFADFEALLKFAQEYHRLKDEPIPSLNNDSRGKIESCLSTPFQIFYGAVAFKGLFKKAAALFYYIAKGHPLANGNKRMACITVGFFLFKNHWYIGATNEDLISLARYTANSHAQDKDECMNRIEQVLRECAERMQPSPTND